MKQAVIAARGLGDGLISMVLAYNLFKAGHDVTCFSSPLCQLKRWFPNVPIQPFPLPEGFRTLFAPFDRLIIADHAGITKDHHFGNAKLILHEHLFDRTKNMVENIVSVCQTHLDIKNPTSSNGITPPSHLQWKRHPKRLVIHPMSTSDTKNWSPKKFIYLSQSLSEAGYEPVFCMSPAERATWSLQSSLHIPEFHSIDDLACFVYESGGMIGNDSGVGHLASCLNIPTVSIFARKRYAQLWRPGWGQNCVVTPPPFLIGAPMRQKLWKGFLSPRRVFSHSIKHLEQSKS